MDQLLDFLKIIVPASLVLYAMYLTLTTFLSKDFDKKMIDIRVKNTDIILPIRLQAYERVVLFLERITPNHLILRVNNPTYSAKEFQQVLLREIREEFNHNMSQQVYMSDVAWNYIKKTSEDLMAVINTAANSLPSEASGLDLAKRIFEIIIQQNSDITSEALSIVKDEIRQLF